MLLPLNVLKKATHIEQSPLSRSLNLEHLKEAQSPATFLLPFEGAHDLFVLCQNDGI